MEFNVSAHATAGKSSSWLAQDKLPPSARNAIVAVQFVDSWLPQTSTWLYNQTRFLPKEVTNIIVCKKTENLDQFGMSDIYSLRDLSRSTQYLERIRRKVGLSRPFGLHLPLLENAIRKFKPDILHTHFGNMGWVNALLANKYGLKHVVSFYGADVNYLPSADSRWLHRYRELGSCVNQVLCEGPKMAESIAKLGIPEQKIKVHRLGIDLSRIPFRPRRREKGMPLRVLIVGTFRQKKGIPYALESLGRLSRVENLQITLIGNANQSEREQAEKRQILATLKKWNLESKCRILGVQPYDVVLNEAYHHHIFLSPSISADDGDTEGGAPVSIIEMAASGMPIVSTTHCDIPFVLSRANAEYLVRERDSEALFKALQDLIATDWQDLARSNRLFIEENLDVRRQGRRLYRIYQALFAGQHGASPYRN